ncbi:MAG: DUF4838 domain-containing protein [Kiritimatiellia bacterium]|jgi:hypothetical protein|nr:DUF4838 domain-containing protein [Kiritimatiellia bacterium]
MRTHGISLALAGLTAFAAAEGVRDYVLVKDGRSDAVIQMNPCPTAPEYRAAVELQEYVRRISGAELKRSTYPAVHARVGGNAGFIEILPVSLTYARLLAPEAVRERLARSPCADAFYIKTDGDRIFIVGKNPIGALYGTYTFIEKYLGVRWLHPGADGECCPEAKTITLAGIDDFQEPAVARRYLNCYEKSVEPWTMEEVRTWQMRRKMNFTSRYHYPNRSREHLDFYACGNDPVFGGGHLTFEAAVPRKAFALHPEYFPWRDGKRVCEERSQRCLANPEVQRRVIAFVTEMTAYGARFSVSFHDSGFEHWCQCPACMELGTHNGTFTVANLAHRFTRLVTDAVLAKNPEAALDVDMYNVFRDLPTDPAIRYDSRVRGLYCPHQRCYVHRLEDPDSGCNAPFLRQILEWRRRIPKIGIYDYYSVAHSPYAPMEFVLAQDIRFYKRIGLENWNEDACNASPMMASNWQLYYVAAVMLWDAAADVDALMAEAYDAYYGPAREPMKRYHAYRRELWEGAPGHVAYGGPDRINHCLTVDGAEKRLIGYLDAAARLAGNDAALKRRIAADRDYLTRFWIAGAAKLKKIKSAQNDVPVRRFAGTLALDGALDEEAWRQAQPVTGFLTPEGAEPTEQTRVRVLYDDRHWYVGIEAMTEKAWSALTCDAWLRDAAEICHDDSVEILLAPPESEYYHWIVNSAGVFYDAKRRDPAFDSRAEIRTRVLRDRYVIEARIPAEPMGVKIRDGQVWRIHFWRTCTNLQPPKTHESSAPDGTGPHNAVLFRQAVVGTPVLSNGSFAECSDTPPEALAKGSLSGARFPVGWGGTGARLIRGPHNRNQVELRGGVLYGFLQVPLSGKAGRIAGTVTASGSGKLNVWLSSCIRKPGDGKRGFGHEIRHDAGSRELSETRGALTFTVDLAPYETGYLYLGASDRAVIDSVAVTHTVR